MANENAKGRILRLSSLGRSGAGDARLPPDEQRRPQHFKRRKADKGLFRYIKPGSGYFFGGFPQTFAKIRSLTPVLFSSRRVDFWLAIA
jgi:hypothetical protein